MPFHLRHSIIQSAEHMQFDMNVLLHSSISNLAVIIVLVDYYVMIAKDTLPVSPEELVAFFESVVEQHVYTLQSHLSIIYVLCLLLHLLLLLLLGLLGTRHCLYYSSEAAGSNQCDGELNMILILD